MIIPETAVTLKDGTKVILRSPQRRDAAQLNEYLRLTSGETHYMVRYPEECDRTLEAAQKRLWAVTDHERSFMLAAFLDGELVGNCGINAMSDHFKMRHRASLGISIKKKSVGAGARQASDGKGAGAGEGKRLYAGGAGGVCRQ